MNKKIQTTYFAPFPVYYHTGIYRELAKCEDLDFKVIYQDDKTIKPHYVEEFKTTIVHDMQMLGGYKHEFVGYHDQDKFLFKSVFCNIKILKKFILERPDVLILNGYTKISDWLLLLGAKFAGTAVIMRGEATLKGNEKALSFKSIFKTLILKLAMRFVSAVMYSCTGNKDYWLHYGASRTKLFPLSCAVDNSFYQQQHSELYNQRHILRQQLKIPKQHFVILCPARMTSRKRGKDLIIATRSARNRANVHLLFVGDGPEQENLRSLATASLVNAVFTGFEQHSRIPQYYSMADACAILSEYDPSPKTINEAMNFGLPIFTTDIVGTAKDLILEGRTGYIIKVGDTTTLAAHIDRLCENPHLATDMGQEAKRHVQGFNFQLNGKQLLTAIQSAMNR